MANPIKHSESSAGGEVNFNDDPIEHDDKTETF